jgi:hypothetical protein
VIDETHLISTLFNLTNVPAGVWINEDGIIVRPPETAYSKSTKLDIGGRSLASDGDAYVLALRDWVTKGSDSEFALSAEEVTEKLSPRTSNQSQAEAYFQIGTHFQKTGNETLANQYWVKAQELRPESWNYHRQDWSFTPKEQGGNWLKKFMSMDKKEEYYPTLELPSSSD